MRNLGGIHPDKKYSDLEQIPPQENLKILKNDDEKSIHPDTKYSDLEQIPPLEILKDNDENDNKICLGFIEKEDDIIPIICLKQKLNSIVLNWYKTFNVNVCIQPVEQPITLFNTSKYIENLQKKRTCQNFDIKLPPNFYMSTSKQLSKMENIWKPQEFYDVLNPFFGSTCEFLESFQSMIQPIQSTPDCATHITSTVNEVNDTSYTNLTIILYMDTLQTYVVPNLTSDMSYILDKRTEFGFIEVCTITIKAKQHDEVCKRFNNTNFFTVENLEEELIHLSDFLFSSVQSIEESDIVQSKLIERFIKTESIADRIKASTIYDIIIKTSPRLAVEFNPGFKNRLATYLNNWNLKKKRYNDGIYYYGLKIKPLMRFANEHIPVYPIYKEESPQPS